MSTVPTSGAEVSTITTNLFDPKLVSPLSTPTQLSLAIETSTSPSTIA